MILDPVLILGVSAMCFGFCAVFLWATERSIENKDLYVGILFSITNILFITHSIIIQAYPYFFFNIACLVPSIKAVYRHGISPKLEEMKK
jgi:hypothetical protein